VNALPSFSFNVDICANAIMSNHYHLVLHIDEQHNESLTHKEICKRWCQLYSTLVLVERWQIEQTISEAENKAALTIINGWRGRLADILWFMHCLNEFIARKANKEDECSSRFYSLPSMVLTLRPAKAALICSLQISGREDSSLKHY